MSQIILSNKTNKIPYDFFLTMFKLTEKEFERDRNLPLRSNIKSNHSWSSNRTYNYIERYATDQCLYIAINLINFGIQVKNINFF